MTQQNFIDQRDKALDREWVIGSTVRITSNYQTIPYLVGMVGLVVDRGEGYTILDIHGQPRLAVPDEAVCFYDHAEAEARR